MFKSENNEFDEFKDSIGLSELSIQKKLGEGYFGIVYHARYMV